MSEGIRKVLVTAWYAPTKRRRYLSKAAAIHAEAMALIRKRHPTERSESDTGYPGWTWRELPRSEVLLRRVKRLVRLAAEAADGVVR